jgi:predicted RNA-binding protein with PUA-like domain
MRYWLMKSEPEAYSIDDLVRDGETWWDGVRNYQARNNLKLMKVGDLAFFYRSVKKPAIVGIMKIVEEAVIEDNSWVKVKVRLIKVLKPAILLDDLKRIKGLEEMRLFKQSRLSVSEVSEKEWKIIT